MSYSGRSSYIYTGVHRHVTALSLYIQLAILRMLTHLGRTLDRAPLKNINLQMAQYV